MDKDQQIRAASGALVSLQTVDSSFRDHLKATAASASDFGSLTLAANEMSATCLGVQIKIIGRPIAIDGEPVAFEYLFGEERDGALVIYWRLYLDRNGSLFADVDRKTRLWDFNNRYVVKSILIELGLALLRSARFAATP